MAVKKPAGQKTPVRAKKSRASVPSAEAPTVNAELPATRVRSVWALPIAMLLLIVAASGLWMAMRESSSQTQAATPAATSAVMTPVREARTAPSMPAAAPAPSRSASSSPAAAPAAEASKPVSITGCLKRDGDAFVLKNTEGTAAPKSRSWKSGFLKRSASTVVLTDPGSAASLADHVGQRVSVTGPLADHELRVQSLRRVASACE